ncbi:threonine synthase [uncultured Paenibacillus sp.]|uniref:threonine synthase n=1 Tax=uncultured Paenibacillus sp. TaxID=227322 RepID=UPI0028D8CCD2|nr:threonine synthase [uncultured Paenibacillus sp.]
MNAFEPVCPSCGAVYGVEPLYICRQCGGSLDIRYDYEKIFRHTPFKDMAVRSGGGMWKYRELLPVLPGIPPVTLGEGGTPLLPANRIPNIRNISSLYLKTESVNPTLAFKDRPLSVALTAAKQFGMAEVVCASTGNTGVAASAYAARAEMRCTVYVPAGTPPEKLAAMEQYGAHLETVDGSFSDAYAAAGLAAERRHAFNLTSTYLNPYAAEGDKTVAYELLAELGRVPDWITVPIGAGPLLAGIYKGFREMKLAGYIDRLPRMAGIQAAGCAPIAEAFRAGENNVRPWSGAAKTIASGIADPLFSYAEDGTRTLSVIRESGGTAAAIADEELIRYRKLLAEKEGVLAELSSVASVAVLECLLEKAAIKPSDTVIAIVTGHGLKDMSAAIKR